MGAPSPDVGDLQLRHHRDFKNQRLMIVDPTGLLLPDDLGRVSGLTTKRIS